jgi:hypothetical protein
MLDKLWVDERKVKQLILSDYSGIPPASEGEKRSVITRVAKHDFLSQSSQTIHEGWKAVDGINDKNASLQICRQATSGKYRRLK